jgi:hypothetical protein
VACVALPTPSRTYWLKNRYGRNVNTGVTFFAPFLPIFFMGALLILRAPIAVRSSTQRRQQISATGLSEFSLKRFAGRCIHCDPLERNAARHFLPLEQGEM